MLLGLKFLSTLLWCSEFISIREFWWYLNQDPRINIIYNLNYNQDIHIFGYYLYTSFFFLFLLCGVLLLISMICSLVLILRSKENRNYVLYS